MIACTKKTEAQDASKKKVLVAYFSATGTTKAVAEQIAEATGGDLFEIAPAVPYTSADLDWTDKRSRSSLEMADASSRPALKATKGDIGRYDVVYVGYPIWWYTAPTIINTFIEAHNLKGKTVIPFATSGGSSIDRSVADLAAAYPDIRWGKGALLNRPTTAKIRQFVGELGRAGQG